VVPHLSFQHGRPKAPLSNGVKGVKFQSGFEIIEMPAHYGI
jgi:hypothetical protein